MFCPQCGTKAIQTAKFCHNCAKELPGSASPIPSGNTGLTSGSSTSKRAHSFQDFRRKKEEERCSRFSSKKPKGSASTITDPKEVTIQIGVIKMCDDGLKFVRGSNLPLKVISTISSDDLLTKAVAKHSLFNKDIVNRPVAYKLLYPDRTQVQHIPGTEESFVLNKYKEVLGKPYGRISLYICRNTDYLDSITLDFMCDIDLEDLHKNDDSAASDGDSLEEIGTKSRDRRNRSTTTVTATCTSNEKDQKEVKDKTKLDSSLWTEYDDVDIFENHPAPSVTSTSEPCKTEPDSREEAPPIKTIINDHSKNVMKDHTVDGFQHVVVRRNYILPDSMRWFKRADFEITLPLQVRFIGEMAEDWGGPRREWLQLLLRELTSSPVFHGEPGFLLPSSTLLYLVDGTVYQVGRMVASILIQGGPAPCVFSPLLIDYIVGKAKPKVEDVPLITIKQMLQEVLISKKTVKDNSVYDEICDEIGWYKEITDINAKEFVEMATYHYCLVKNRANLDEFIRGLDSLQLVKLIKQYPEQLKDVMCSGAKQLTPDDVYNLFFFDYNGLSGSNLRQQEEAASMSFMLFLMECTNKDSKVKLEDFLQFLSGSSSIPPGGFDVVPTILFGDSSPFPTVSTCALTLRLPLKLQDEVFNTNMVEAVLNSPFFGKV